MTFYLNLFGNGVNATNNYELALQSYGHGNRNFKCFSICHFDLFIRFAFFSFQLLFNLSLWNFFSGGVFFPSSFFSFFSLLHGVQSPLLFVAFVIIFFKKGGMNECIPCVPFFMYKFIQLNINKKNFKMKEKNGWVHDNLK